MKQPQSQIFRDTSVFFANFSHRYRFLYIVVGYVFFHRLCLSKQNTSMFVCWDRKVLIALILRRKSVVMRRVNACLTCECFRLSQLCCRGLIILGTWFPTFQDDVVVTSLEAKCPRRFQPIRKAVIPESDGRTNMHWSVRGCS